VGKDQKRELLPGRFALFRLTAESDVMDAAQLPSVGGISTRAGRTVVNEDVPDHENAGLAFCRRCQTPALRVVMVLSPARACSIRSPP